MGAGRLLGGQSDLEHGANVLLFAHPPTSL